MNVLERKIKYNLQIHKIILKLCKTSKHLEPQFKGTTFVITFPFIDEITSTMKVLEEEIEQIDTRTVK